MDESIPTLDGSFDVARQHIHPDSEIIIRPTSHATFCVGFRPSVDLRLLAVFLVAWDVDTPCASTRAWELFKSSNEGGGPCGPQSVPKQKGISREQSYLKSTGGPLDL